MTKYERIRGVIRRVYEDGRQHGIGELREACRADGIDLETDRHALNNVLFQMKKNGYLMCGEEKGVYWKAEREMENGAKGENADSGSEKREAEHGRKGEDMDGAVKALSLDWKQYFILEPERGMLSEKKMTVTEKGEIRLSAPLRREMGTRKIELAFSRDMQTVYLNPNGEHAHAFTKAGTAKSRELAEILRKMKAGFPAVYMVKWDDETAAWKGKLDGAAKK